MRVRRGVLGLLTRGLAFGGYTPAWIARQVATAAAMSLVASGLVNLFLAPNRVYLTFWQLWLLIAGGLLVQWFAEPVREPARFSEVSPELATDETARPYPIADRWAHRLSVTSGDPEWFGRVARDRLAALVAERVRQRHGVRTAGPELLGDELYEFLTAPITRTPSPAELDRLITRMEQI
jgi:hypothetical protein